MEVAKRTVQGSSWGLKSQAEQQYRVSKLDCTVFSNGFKWCSSSPGLGEGLVGNWVVGGL